jgi:hypothetical protein
MIETFELDDQEFVAPNGGPAPCGGGLVAPVHFAILPLQAAGPRRTPQ